MSKECWTGTWEDSDGYWVKIEVKEEQVFLSRSGNLKSKLSFIEFSGDSGSLIYDEIGDGLNFRHTLSILDDGSIEDLWLDLEKNIVWKRGVLSNKDESAPPARVNQGPACEVVFDESEFNDLQVSFISRLLPEIRAVLKEELPSASQECLDDLAEKVGFSVASSLDGCDVIGDNQSSVPHLAFRADGRVITNKSGSFMHEMVSGYFVDELN